MNLGILFAVITTFVGLWALSVGFHPTIPTITPAQSAAPAEKAAPPAPATVEHRPKKQVHYYDSLVDNCRLVFARLANKPVSEYTMPDIEQWNSCKSTMASVEYVRRWDAANPEQARRLHASGN